jgi:hypothetical protein
VLRGAVSSSNINKMRSVLLSIRAIALMLGASAILVVAGCDLGQPYRDIFGTWRADQLTVGGVGIPIAPNMEFDSGKAVIAGTALPVESYSREGERITVHLKGAPSLTFEMQGKDVMAIEVPLIGKTRYTRVK